MITMGGRVLAIACAVAVIGLGAWPPRVVYAQSVGCSVALSPDTVGPGSNVNFSIEVTNTGINDIRWIDFMAPSDKFVYAGNSISNAWSTADHQGGTTASGGTIASGSNENFSLSLGTGVQLAETQNWIIQVSDDVNGSNPRACGGTLGTSIRGSMPQDSAVGVSDVMATAIATTSATITWRSDMDTSSIVYFGKTAQYGQTSAYSGNLSTQHSVTLTGLTPATVYHFQVVGDDGAGSIVYSLDNTFTTAQPAAGAPEPPKPVVVEGAKDRSVPTVLITTPLQKVYQSPPTLSGTAMDNIGVVSVEYSTDGGKNWLPVDQLKTAGAQKVTFSFAPLTPQDGNYEIILRAKDDAGNIGISSMQTMVIDRLPPLVGGMLTSVGPQIVQPDEQGTTHALLGKDQQITISAVGGPTSVVVEATSEGRTGTRSFSLAKSPETGLWNGALAFQQAGVYTLRVLAVDGAGNKTERLLHRVIVDKAASIIDARTGKSIDATVRVYYRDPDTGGWVLWDGPAYGQANPISSGPQGYSAYLPVGTYYLDIRAKGYRSEVTKSITLSSPTIVSQEVRLTRSSGFRLGVLQVLIPHITLRQTVVRTTNNQSVAETANKIRSLPDFSTKTSTNDMMTTRVLYGKPTIVTFVATWSPPARDQMAILASVDAKDVNIVPISSGESRARLAAYTGIAGYKLPIVVDATNRLSADFGVASLPTHYFVDRHGDVKKVMVGVLSKEELLRYVSVGL